MALALESIDKIVGRETHPMDEGEVLQAGLTPEVYRHPGTTRVAEIFSDPPINYLDGSVASRGVTIGPELRFPLNGHMASLTDGDFRFGVRCNHLCLKPSSSNDVLIRAIVELSEINGSETFLHVRYDGTRLVIQEDGIHPLRIGREIAVYVNPSCFFVYDGEGNLAASPENDSPAKSP